MIKSFNSSDPDTVVTNWFYLQLGQYLVLHESWKWEAVKGNTLQFFSRQVDDLDDDALISVCSLFPYFDPDTPITIKRGMDLTYVNFNFSY